MYKGSHIALCSLFEIQHQEQSYLVHLAHLAYLAHLVTISSCSSQNPLWTARQGERPLYQKMLFLKVYKRMLIQIHGM